MVHEAAPHKAKGILRSGLGSAPSPWRETQGKSTARNPPEIPAARLGNPLKTTMKLSLTRLPSPAASLIGDGGCGALPPLRIFTSVRTIRPSLLGAKYLRLPQSFRLRYRRISLVAHPQFHDKTVESVPNCIRPFGSH
jgi:hypothetical protein